MCFLFLITMALRKSLLVMSKIRIKDQPWVKNRMQVNKQKNSKKSRLGHQTGPLPRKAAGGDKADRKGKGRGLQARVKAA